MALAEWKAAARPNYTVNINKNYPYSELPFLGEYYLVRIPTSGELIEHVDYWGEGRIEISDGNSGFRDCYNVNRQYQLVSNGDDRDRKIPNRIPVYSESVCDTTSYIKNDSVKLVTLMGAPIIESSAHDIARIVNNQVGSVVVFGFDKNSGQIRMLETALRNVSLFYCPNYDLPKKLQDLTLFDSHLAFLNETDIGDELYNAVTGGLYNNAIEISKSLTENNGGHVVSDIVKKLLEQGIQNIMPYAYQLWSSGETEIVKNYFPLAFKLIFNDDKVKIESNYYNMALKLDANVDYYNDRLAWGDKSDHSSNRVSWKFIPSWENNNVNFKINNIEHNMFLKLDVNVDSIGDRKCWGSNSSNELRHFWRLKPVQLNNEVVFFIVNREYDQALKLDAHTDWYGDRLVWGTSGNVVSNPKYFGWLLKPW